MISPELIRIVNYWAFYTFVRCNKSIPVEDIRQDFWIVVLESKKKWQPLKAPFSTYVYKKLKWEATDKIKTFWAQGELEQKYCEESGRDTSPFIEESYPNLCNRIDSKIKSSKAKKVFWSLANPPQEFLSSLHHHEQEFSKDKRFCSKMNQNFVAKYLGMSMNVLVKSMRKIEKIVEKELTQ